MEPSSSLFAMHKNKIKLFLINVYVNAEPQRSKEEVTEDLEQDPPVEFLHCDENMKGSIPLFRLSK